MTVFQALVRHGPLFLGAIVAFVGCVLAIRHGPVYRRKHQEGPRPVPADEPPPAEIARLREENAHLSEQLRRLADAHAALAPLLLEIDCRFDSRNLGGLVLRVLDRIFSPPRAAVFVPDRDRARLTVVGTRGIDGLSEGERFPIEEGIAGRSARFLTPAFRLPGGRRANGCPGLDLAVPIAHRRELYGVIAVGGIDLDASEMRVLSLVADLTAVALVNHAQYRRIQRLANSDPMTGIFNKAYFLGHTHVRLALARHTRRPMSLLMIDVDHFKDVNDHFGHIAGDRLLKALVRVVAGELRSGDTLARFGGEEFVALLDGIGKAEAHRVAERIRSRVANHPFAGGDRQPLGRISISVGVSTLGEDGTRLEPLLQAADRAMYRAKEAGRDRVTLA